MRKAALFLTLTILAVGCLIFPKTDPLLTKYLSEPEQFLMEWVLTPRGEPEARFFRLLSDTGKFYYIQNFWEMREREAWDARELFYARVRWANQNFREEVPGNGWRTDRGRVFILAGPPSFIENYTAYGEPSLSQGHEEMSQEIYIIQRWEYYWGVELYYFEFEYTAQKSFLRRFILENVEKEINFLKATATYDFGIREEAWRELQNFIQETHHAKND